MNEQNKKRQALVEICKEKEIEKIDISYGWVSILKKENKQQKIINDTFDLNSEIGSKLANDKYATYELLKFYQIPILQHQVLFNENLMKNVAYINQNYNALKNDEKQVIKANNSLQGIDVYVSSNQEEKIKLVKNMFDRGIEAVVVCPYQEIEYEYRALFLYDEIIYIYKKKKPYVVGDGASNLEELISKNLKYLEEPLEGLDLNYVPANGEKVIVGWKHNLSNGAVPIIIDENDVYYDRVKQIALNAGKALDLKFASVDIFVTNQNQIYVMEVNSSVCITKFCELVPNGYEIGKGIYSKVLDKIFED